MKRESIFNSSILGEAGTVWQAGEALTDLLGNIADLKSACQTALSFILEATDLTSGVLLIFSPGNAEPELVIHENLPSSWETQVQNRRSNLRRYIQYLVDQGITFATDSISAAPKAPRNLAAALPILVNKEALGILLLRGKHCTPEEMDRLAVLLSPVGRTIRLDRILRATRKRAEDLTALEVHLASLAFKGDLDGVESYLIEESRRLLNSEAVVLALLDETNDGLIIQKSLQEDRNWIYKIIPSQGKGLVRECLRSSQALLVNETQADPLFDSAWDQPDGIEARCMLCAPIKTDGKTLGVIQAFNKCRGAFDEADQDLLTAIARLAATILQGARTVQHLKIASADLQASRWELRGSRNTLRAIFDNLPASLYIIDREFRLTAINRVRALRAGQIPQELVGQPCYQALFKRSEPCIECRVHETIHKSLRTLRSERRWSTEEEFTEWEIYSYPILDENNQLDQVILVEEDVTEKRRLEAILTQSEKLAAVGQLAAGVAHEINNPLTAIIANAQILHRELPPNHDLQESVDLIARAGARAHQVVRNLLDFARKEDYHLSLTDLNETVDKAIELMKHELISHGIHLEFQPDPNLPALLASQDHLQSVWLNLLLNAMDALNKSPAEIKITTRRVGGEIHISVSDNGKGIPADRLTRIFEPFYTTKAPGRGTGLGLSVSHRIVKQHGGNIRVESQEGEGSTFTVILPLS